MSNPQELYGKVSQLVATIIQTPLTTDDFEQELHLDSMALLELLVSLEKEFGIEVDESELDPASNFRSVVNISEFISEKLQ